MSLLQDILDKMYVEPELLEQLDEEQKQTLFIKMREEQVRRWEMNEARAEEEERRNPRSKKNRNIQWLTGRDNEIWVWVMGEHPDDPSIEQIIEEENQRRAREIAEGEARRARELEHQPLADLDNSLGDDSMSEQFLKKQLSEMQFLDVSENDREAARDFLTNLQPSVSFPEKNNAQIFPGNVAVTNISANSTQQPVNYFSSQNQTQTPKAFPNGNQDNVDYLPNGKKLTPPPIPSRPAFLQRKPKEEFGQTVKSYIPGREPTAYPSTRMGPVPFPSVEETNSLPIKLIQEIVPNENATNGNIETAHNKLVKFRVPTKPLEEDIEKRQSEIFEQLMEERQRRKMEAELEEERRRKEFEEREKKSREAEAEIRMLAQKARMMYQKNLRTSDALLPVLNQGKATSLKEAIRQARPPRPVNREAIVQWYVNVEIPKGTGFDPKTNLPARWFHGIISRNEAEDLLSDKPQGAFLVRVSEKIWGYTISYVIGSGKSKHFLVEVIPDGYQFLGTNQVVHKSLYDLILYHETAPITAKGKEILRLPVGQSSNRPDYADLIDMTTLNGPNLDRDTVDTFPSDAEDGIYVGYAKVDDGELYPMVMSIGNNPQYENKRKSIEIHILHKFEGDFYGSKLRAVVLDRLRGMLKFNSLDLLKEAIAKDKQDATDYLDQKGEFDKWNNESFFLSRHS
ncbi:hypothetical protein FO519_000629 [Halicephalobus sp. NKZ332]|nr:hypothetical protein FO519_000629 [Halicephalobus sp. NKZ332]